MKTFNQFLTEALQALDARTKRHFYSNVKKYKLDGNGRFNSLRQAKDALEKIMGHSYFMPANETRFEMIFRGDRDIIGDKGRGVVPIKVTRNSLVISWEHLESGYALEVYIS